MDDSYEAKDLAFAAVLSARGVPIDRIHKRQVEFRGKVTNHLTIYFQDKKRCEALHDLYLSHDLTVDSLTYIESYNNLRNHKYN